MNYVSSLTELAILAVDRFLNGAMTSAWTSTLRHQDAPERQASGKRREQPPAEEDYGGGDICSLQEAASAEDDQPLE